MVEVSASNVSDAYAQTNISLDQSSTSVEERPFVSSEPIRRVNISRSHNIIFAHALAFPPSFGSESSDFTIEKIKDYWTKNPLPDGPLYSFGEYVVKQLLDTKSIHCFSEYDTINQLKMKLDNYQMTYFSEYATLPIEWNSIVLACKTCSVIFDNDYEKMPIKAYNGFCSVLSGVMTCERKLLLSCIEYKCGCELPLIASQTNVKNIKYVMSRLKLCNSIPLLHAIFRAPNVKTKLLAIVRLLELYDTFWGELPWTTFEKLGEFLVIAFNWIMEKTELAKDCAAAGFNWVQTKVNDMQVYFGKQKEEPDVVVDLDVKKQCKPKVPILCNKCQEPSSRGCSMCNMHMCADCTTGLKKGKFCGCPAYFHHVQECNCAGNNDCLYRAFAEARTSTVRAVKRSVYSWLSSARASEQYEIFCQTYPSYAPLDWNIFKQNVLDQLRVNVMCETDTLISLYMMFGVSIYVYDEQVDLAAEEWESVVTLRGVHNPLQKACVSLTLSNAHYELNHDVLQEKPTTMLWGAPFSGWDEVPVYQEFKTVNQMAKNHEDSKKIPAAIVEKIPKLIKYEQITEDMFSEDESECSSESSTPSFMQEDIKRCTEKFAALHTHGKDPVEPDTSEDRVCAQNAENTQRLNKENKQTWFEYMKSLEWSEIGKLVKDWFLNASKSVIEFFQNNPIVTGMISIVVGIASFLGISVVNFSSNVEGLHFIKKFADTTRTMYYAERGAQGLISAFSATMDAAKDILGISKNPTLDKFKHEVASNLELAESMLELATNNCGKFVNDSSKFLEFKKNIELIRKSYYDLAKMHADKDLMVIQPIWNSLNRVFEKLQLTYNKVMASSMSRQEPVVVYLHGNTAIGKSHFATHLINQINVRTKSQMKTFTISKGPEYWNGFAQQEVIRIDDMNAVIGPEGDKDSALIFDLATSAPYNPNQASLEDKAIMANPKYLFVCSNHLTIPTNSMVTEQAAWERRRHIMVNVTWPEHEKNCPKNATDCPCLQALKEYEKKHGHKKFDHLVCTLIDPMTSSVAPTKAKKPFTKNPRAHYNGSEDAILNSLLEQGAGITSDEIVQMAIVKERDFFEVFQRSMRDSIAAGSMQAKSWSMPPQVFLLGPPGTGKSHMLQRYMEEAVGTKKIFIKNRDDFDKWAKQKFKQIVSSIVVVNDLSQCVDSPHFQEFFERVIERYDENRVPDDLWICAGNEDILTDKVMDMYNNVERVQMLYRRAEIFRTSFKQKGSSVKNAATKLFNIKPKYYVAEDVVDPLNIDKYVQYEHKGNLLTQYSAVSRLIAYVPVVNEVKVKTALVHKESVPMSSVLQIALSSGEFLDMINTTSIVKIMSVLTHGKAKSFSKTLDVKKLSTIIFRATTKAKKMMKTHFDSLDALILQIWNESLLEELKGECLVLKLDDVAYFADYTKELECGILKNYSDLEELKEELKEHVHKVTVSDVMSCGRSILPHWLVLAGEIASTIFSVAATTIAAVESVRDQTRMFESDEFLSKVTSAVEKGTAGMKDQFVTKMENGLSHLAGTNKLKPGIQYPKKPQYGDIEDDNFFLETPSPDSSANARPKDARKQVSPDASEKSKPKDVRRQAKLEKEIQAGWESYARTNFTNDVNKTVIVKEAVKFQLKSNDVIRKEKPITKEGCFDPATFDILNKMLKNCVEIITVTGERLCSGLVVRGRCIRTVRHLLDTVRIQDIRIRTMAGTIWKVKILFEDRIIDRLDLQVEDLTFPCYPDITVHFPSTKYTIEEGTHAVLLTPDMCVLKGTVTVMVRPYIVNNLMYRHFLQDNMKLHVIEYKGHRAGYTATGVNTKYGDCGSILIVTDPSLNHGKVIGMHIAASETKAYASPLRCGQYEEKPVFQVNPQHFLSSKWFRKVEIEDDPKILAVSKLPNHVPAKTKLFRNWYPIGEKLYEPAILSSRDPRGDGESLLRSESLKWCSQREELTAEQKQDLMNCAEEIAYHDVDILRGEDISLRKLTSTEALNKMKNASHSEPINTHTSAGYPWQKMTDKRGKTAFINIGENGERRFNNDPAVASLVGQLHSAIDDLEKGKDVDVVFQVMLKDELVKLKKIYQNPRKTRTIAVAPLHFTIAYRKYFHAAHAAQMQCWNKMPSKIGINPMGYDWHELITSAMRVSTFGIDIDFKDWDFSGSVFFMLLLLRYYEILFEELDPNCTQEDQDVRRRLYIHLMLFKILVGNEVWETTGGTPSGYGGTGPDNSKKNEILAYYCWVVIMRRINTKLANYRYFVEEVWHGCYGDDFLMAISQWAAKYFNGITISAEMLKLGFKAQTADKSSEMIAIKPLVDCIFLSRRFKLFGSIWMGPLVRSSLDKPTWYSSDRRSHYFWESPEDKIRSPDIVSNVYEMLLYNAALESREVFEVFRKAALKVQRDVNGPLPLSYEDTLTTMFGFAKPPAEVLGVEIVDCEDVLSMDWNHSQPEYVSNFANRTSYNFGPQYNYTGSALSNPMPRNIKRIMQHINLKFKKNFNSVLINVYPPGGKIPFHKDNEPGLDMSEGVLGVTLRGDGQITWKNGAGSVSRYLDPGVGYLMDESNLKQYSHSRDNHTQHTITMTLRKIDTSA
uniref:Polyprotein n=1 Tax=Picornavirales sp. TaxID=1955153 RepID=A0A6M3YNX8_9VIRU|nr:MAG: hypothetical protein 1 [Picornavirales sp.]